MCVIIGVISAPPVLYSVLLHGSSFLTNNYLRPMGQPESGPGFVECCKLYRLAIQTVAPQNGACIIIIGGTKQGVDDVRVLTFRVSA